MQLGGNILQNFNFVLSFLLNALFQDKLYFFDAC